ncbi:hypothetical protein BU16DRAFT_507020 [Lophium mytilinum]|uniref:Uncharacterized protein n=1 Tax=Lophium mytilinum TaxID=390894 RepID=A0A6A6QXM8_9PEZI|nr:hypothetical protein BU16DRAFT_507020 [Lophium mytilinum]
MSVPAFGDFVKLIELANEVYRRFMDAPEQFQALSDEVKGLEAVLGNVKSILSKRELTSKQTEVLVSIFVGCQNVLTPMNTKLEKYQGIEPHKKDSDIQNMRVKFRTAWKKVNWDAKEVQELRGRLTSNISLLNVFYADLNSQAISKIHVHQENQNLQTETAKAQAKRREILDWLTLLTPVNYTTQQDDFIRRRQEHTGEWLLGSSEFQTWFRNKNQTLFCPGIPGAGKTIMTSIVVDNLHSSLKKGDNIGISCIYCNFRRHHEQKPEDLLSSILRQLVEGQPVIPDEIEILYSHLKDIRARPSLKQILTVLQAVILTFSKTFIIVDALDECQISDGGRQKFLTALFNLQVQTESNIFATSRYIPEITARFASAIRVEIRATDEDVRRYVDGRLPELPPFVSRNPNLQEHVKSVLVEAVEGMFLLVDLHFSSLVGKKSAKALKTTLKTLPRGSDAYDRSYDDIMGRIKGQVGDYQQLAMESLSWITKTKRPLTATELQFALAIEIGEPRFDEENIPELEDIISVCAGLVTVDEKSRIIRLVHYTTQDYFERTWKTWFPDAHTLITNALVTYISMDARHGLESIFWHFSHSRPLFDLELYPYALKYWGKHARLALESKLDPASTWEEVKEPILNFLQKEKSLKAASRFAAVQSESTGRHARFRIGILFAAYFGLEHAVTTLFELGQDITVVDDTGRTPLYYAARNGHHIAVVKLLLTDERVQVNAFDSAGQTPLGIGLRRGTEEVVKLLLADERVDVNAVDSEGRSPLTLATSVPWLEQEKEVVMERWGYYPNEQDDREVELKRREGREAVIKLLSEDDRVIDKQRSSQLVQGGNDVKD